MSSERRLVARRELRAVGADTLANEVPYFLVITGLVYAASRITAAITGFGGR